MKDYTCSIDKITALTYIPNLSFFFNSTKINLYTKSTNSNPYIEKSYRSTKPGEYDMNINCIDGSFIQINTNKKTGEENVRISFNPNNFNQIELQKMFAFMKYPRITRIDFAVDYWGYDLSNLLIKPRRAMDKTIHIAASGKLESIEIGSGNGDKRINFYDKGHKERKVLPKNRPEWWRIEMQRARFKGEEDYFKNPFEGMLFMFPASVPTGTRIQDEALLRLLQEEPHRWGELSTRIKKHMKELEVTSSVKLEPHPAEVFECYRETMEAQVQEIFAPMDRNSPFYQAQ